MAGEAILLHVLNERMKLQQSFTLEDARYVYCKAKKRGIQTGHIFENGTWVRKTYQNGFEHIKENPTAYDDQMKSWLKLNLGSLMMKGALVAIPIIKLGFDCLDEK